MTRSPDALADDVRRSLRDQAGRIDVGDEPFDPTRSGLTLDLTRRDATGLPDRADHRRRTVTLVAIAAALCLLAGVTVAVVAATRHSSTSSVDAAAGPGLPASPWFTPTGPEKPAPAVPDGWQVRDYGLVRFAVPAGWTLVPAGECPPPIVAGGLVEIRSPGDRVPYCPAAGPTPPTLSITAGPVDATKPTRTPATVGTFSALADAPACSSGCVATYHLDNGYVVSATGTDAAQILDTLTDSGVVRALQSGPTADTSGWQTVHYGDLSFAVPSDWAIVDLNAEGTTATTVSDSNQGGCGLIFSEKDQPHIVFTGQGVSAGCPAAPVSQIVAGDGLWLRNPSDIGFDIPHPVASATLAHGATVIAWYPDPTQAVVELLVRYAGSDMEISVGAADPTVARTILQTFARS